MNILITYTDDTIKARDNTYHVFNTCLDNVGMVLVANRDVEQRDIDVVKESFNLDLIVELG